MAFRFGPYNGGFVEIGNQTWWKKNSNIKRYRNGDIIPQAFSLSDVDNATFGVWAYPNFDSANEDTYGILYNWYAVNDPRGLAPIGSHIPSNVEFYNLLSYSYNIQGGNSAGGLKEVGYNHWQTPNEGANNITGFTALPAGMILSGAGPDIPGQFSYHWTSTQFDNNISYANDPNNAIPVWMYYATNDYVSYGRPILDCMSVRFLKD